MRKTVLGTTAAFAVALAAAARPAAAQEAMLLTGIDATTNANIYGYVGALAPLPAFGNPGSLDQDGFLLRVWGFGQGFDYSRKSLSEVDATGGGFDAGIGYQIVRPNYRVAGYVSYAFRSFHLSPDDPGSELRRHHGVRLQLETQADFNSHVGIEAIAAYAVNFNDYWGRVRPYYRLDGALRAGPEFTLFGGREYDRQRYGGFLSGLKLGPAELSLAAGGERDGRKNEWSAYFNLGATFRFSIR
ncbi:MAG: cellulose biosynthesis protein BcsS [Rhodospirillaceae bacterium]|nr:cellulose biosynthesis protein BcsS [Rhodospirillaceae bacterium]